MSLLWPERVIAGLFPGHCWLQRGDIVDTHVGDFSGADQLLLALDEMISAQEKPLRKGSGLQLLVSDSMAHIIPLPWQELLTSPEELRNFAKVMFDERGTALDDAWIVQTGFRHFRSTGIALAVRRQWMAQLLELLAARGLKLVSVLPVSVAAYWRHRWAQMEKQIVLLHEPGRVTAMLGKEGRFLDLDVQPITGATEQAATRLLKRVALMHEEIQNVAEWHAEGEGALSLETMASACLPELAINRLPLDSWR